MCHVQPIEQILTASPGIEELLCFHLLKLFTYVSSASLLDLNAETNIEDVQFINCVKETHIFR